MGIVSPLGVGAACNWTRLIAGESGIRKIDRFSTDRLASRVAGMVPMGNGPGQLDLAATFSAKEIRRNALFILYALKAAEDSICTSSIM